jgi:hypothetical protein
MNSPHIFHAHDDIPDALQAEPKSVEARLSVAFAAEEAAQHGNLPDDLANRRRGQRDRFLCQDVGPLPLLGREQRRSLKIGVRSAQPYQSCQSCQTLGDHHIYGQRQFQLTDVSQLQRFNATATLQHMKEGLDFPAAAIPVNHLNHRLKGRHHTIRQQTPCHGLNASRCADFPGNRTGHGNLPSLAIRQTDRPRPDLLRCRATKKSIRVLSGQ